MLECTPLHCPACIAAHACWLRERFALLGAALAAAAGGVDMAAAAAAIEWAYTMYSSRAMRVPEAAASARVPPSLSHASKMATAAFGGRPIAAMVPLCDVANHRPGSTARFDVVGGAAAAVAPASKGECWPAHVADWHVGDGDVAGSLAWVEARAPSASSSCGAADSTIPPPASKRRRVDDGSDVMGVEVSSSMLRLIIGAPVRPHSEVCIDYGAKDSTHLAMHGGFVPSCLPGDSMAVAVGEGVPVRLVVMPSTALVAAAHCPAVRPGSGAKLWLVGASILAWLSHLAETVVAPADAAGLSASASAAAGTAAGSSAPVPDGVDVPAGLHFEAADVHDWLVGAAGDDAQRDRLAWVAWLHKEAASRAVQCAGAARLEEEMPLALGQYLRQLHWWWACLAELLRAAMGDGV